MSGEDNDAQRAAVFRTPDGRLIVEIDMRIHSAAAMQQLTDDARAAGADAVWVHAPAVDAALGFQRRGGYARLEAPVPPPPIELPQPPHGIVRTLQAACFAGVWGHHEPGQPPDPAAIYVGLHEAGEWVGICEVDPDAGWIDGPGLVPARRTPDGYARLIRGAAAHLASGPVVLETWGDSDVTLGSYEELGFRLVEYVVGWELNLRAR